MDARLFPLEMRSPVRKIAKVNSPPISSTEQKRKRSGFSISLQRQPDARCHLRRPNVSEAASQSHYNVYLQWGWSPLRSGVGRGDLKVTRVEDVEGCAKV